MSVRLVIEIFIPKYTEVLMTEDKIKAKVQIGILKPASEIFEAIVNPEKMCRYFISGSTGRMEGGKTLTWTWEDFEGEHDQKVGKIEKDKVVSFEWNGSGVNCVVVITLEPKGENQTLVKITESDWPTGWCINKVKHSLQLEESASL